jgi:hypothetical protein
MEILSLLPILLFLLFVIVTILRTKNKIKDLADSKQQRSNPEMNLYKSEKKGGKKQSGWRNRLMDTVAEIQREVKNAQGEMRGKGEKPVKVSYEAKTDFQPPPVPFEKLRKKKTISDVQKPQQASQPVEISEPKIKPDLLPFTNPTRQQLRNAVVWSEILAPPTALRKDQDNFS